MNRSISATVCVPVTVTAKLMCVTSARPTRHYDIYFLKRFDIIVLILLCKGMIYMTTERANILKQLNAFAPPSKSITLVDLTNAAGIVEYGKVEKVLEGLMKDGYISKLTIRGLSDPISFELTERGCNYQLEIDAEIQKAAAEKEAEQRRIAEAEEAKRQRKEEIKQQHIHDFIVAGVSVLLTLLASNFHRIVCFFKGLVS